VRPIQNATFINNTVYSNGNVWGGGFFNENPNVSNVVVRNNIFSQNLTFQIANEKATTLNVDHNLIDGYRGDPAEIRGSDYVEGDPKFVNASSADFHLQSSSAAIDQGSATDAPTNDYDGSPRPQDGEGDGTALHDIGAYEMVPSLSLSCVTDPHPVEAITQLITLLPGFCDRGNHQW
jgi:hypothetical protein